jgi:menaquinol-cytochrome c reductase iron-sulfur subunit
MTEKTPSNPEEVGRRKFLSGIIGVVAGVVAALVGLPSIGYIISPGVKLQNKEKWLTLGPVSSLALGVPTGFPFARQIKDGWVDSTQTGIAYAITRDGQTVRVVSDVCPHLSCRVTWQGARSLYVCPCHDGFFDLDGKVVSGPPPRALDEFQSKIENGQIMILLEA